jgi:hypothetical protein
MEKHVMHLEKEIEKLEDQVVEKDIEKAEIGKKLEREKTEHKKHHDAVAGMEMVINKNAE